MNKYSRLAVVAITVVLLIGLLPADIWAQCPMCRISAESNLANGGTEGRGLNTGILYMFTLPYVLVGAIGYWWWRNQKSEAQEQAGDDDVDARLN